MSKTIAEKGWQGRSLDGLAVRGVYRHPLAREIIAINDSCLRPPTRRTVSVPLDPRYASWIGQGVIDASRGIPASLGWIGSRLLTKGPSRETIYSRSEAPRENHRKGYWRGGKGEMAIAFGCTIMVHIRNQTAGMLRPILRNREGKKA